MSTKGHADRVGHVLQLTITQSRDILDKIQREMDMGVIQLKNEESKF